MAADGSVAQPEDSTDRYRVMAPDVIECPFATYRALRAEAPVYQVPGKGVYLVSRYEDCVAVNRNTDLFSNEMDGVISLCPEADAILAKGVRLTPVLMTADPPTHGIHRPLVERAFSAGRVKKMEPFITGLIDELIDGFIDAGEVELVSAFAAPLPLTVIAQALGVPREMIWTFREWTEACVVRFSEVASVAEHTAAAETLLEFQAYFTRAFEDRRAQPRDDVISELAHATVVGADRPLTLQEFLSIIQQLVPAGNETTTSTIADGMRLLVEHPDQMAALRQDIAAGSNRLLRNLTEEVLRHQSPTQGMWRIAKADTELGGVAIPKGALLNVRYVSANRDGDKFAEPDRFDLNRKNATAHLGFGHGAHFCPGAALARKEIELAFRCLLTRLSDIRFTPGKNDFAHHPSFSLRGLKALYLDFKTTD